ncbi:MAG: Maf family protein [Patescibacteria group bacterium]
MKKIILASGSPRRRELLKQIGVKFKVVPSNYEEDMSLKMSPKKLAEFLSLNKALDVVKRIKGNGIVIAADTFIVYKNHRLGKPHTKAQAFKMLNKLNGKTHSVITGFTIVDLKNKKKVTKSVVTKIYFRKLSSQQIYNYINTGEPLDKAGAYAIQGKGASLIKKIEGDYFNVVGLPLGAVLDEFKKFNINVL